MQKVRPSILVSPIEVDFQKVKAGTTAELELKLVAATKAELTILGARLEDGAAPGGAASFAISDVPPAVPGLSELPMKVRFSPEALQAYEAVLVIQSDDEDRPEVRVPVLGEGAKPLIAVRPQCASENKCSGSVTLEPKAIQFAPEPFQRQLQLDPTTFPSVSIINEGPVELTVTGLAITGPDAAAFTFVGNANIPPEGLPLDAGAGVNLYIRFKPTSETQTDYSAEVVVDSDDADQPQVRVKLDGKLAPNLAPVVCANIVRVLPGDGSAPINYDKPEHWAPLLTPPPGGYDFSSSRNIQPKSDVTLSAWSSADQTACTSDPEDGRIQLTYAWTLVSSPSGAGPLSIGGASTAQATLRPFATGEYVIELSVKDSQGHTTVTTLKFVVAVKEDLVAQLSWNGFSGVDFDVHLVRPSSATSDPFSGAFSFFEEGTSGKTSGDMNGYALIKQRNNPGFDFDWGEVGTADDPRLNLDDTGSGQLIENVSLNYPENDPECASAPCSYKVMVHYFRDARQLSSPASCNVDGTSCHDGERCDCANASTRCVANQAPTSSPATGAGRCFAPPLPVVRIFIKGDPTPAAVIPLDTLSPPDNLELPAPCQMLYVADVEWPAKGALDGGSASPVVKVRGADGTGRITNPQLARFGYRQQNSLQCSPNTTQNGVDWYAPAP